MLGYFQHTKASKKEAENAIKKVWYGELSYCHPLVRDRFNLNHLGIRENLEKSSSRFIFPSWKILQAYYAVYHSIRAMCEIMGVQYNPKQHAAPLIAFKNSKLSPASKVLYRYPFSLFYGKAAKYKKLEFYIPNIKDYFRFNYSNHPRPPHYNYTQCLTRVIDDYKEGWKGYSVKQRQVNTYMLPDLLYDFRVWANYIDIDNIIALKSKGYRSYLDSDLYTILFFHSAFVEISSIAILGAKRTVELMSQFYKDFIESERELWESGSNWSVEDRFRIYRDC